MAEYGTAFFRAKQLDLGDKMDLSSYLLKPVQRMGKYALLLKQVPLFILSFFGVSVEGVVLKVCHSSPTLL